MTMSNIFDLIPDNLETEVLETILDSASVRIERIISKGHTSPEQGWYDQEENEWVIVLKGEAILLFIDESTITLKAGDYINIPARRKHKVKWTDPNIETIWLAIFY